MLRLFMAETPHYEMEMMMLTIPGFHKRKLRDICSCRYCRYYSKKKGCKNIACPYIAQRMEVGILNYSRLLKETYRNKIQESPKLATRIAILQGSYNKDMFLSDEHSHRFYTILSQVKAVLSNPTSRYLAALYLLTTHDRLWQMVKPNVYVKEIYFDKVRLNDLDTECYTYYQMARMLYDGIPRITLSEMTDHELIPDHVFKILTHASLIQIYGMDTLLIKN